MIAIAAGCVCFTLALSMYLRRKQVELGRWGVLTIRIALFVSVGLMLYAVLRPGPLR